MFYEWIISVDKLGYKEKWINIRNKYVFFWLKDQNTGKSKQILLHDVFVYTCSVFSHPYLYELSFYPNLLPLCFSNEQIHVWTEQQY